jgi:hypothetical protein
MDFIGMAFVHRATTDDRKWNQRTRMRHISGSSSIAKSFSSLRRYSGIPVVTDRTPGSRRVIDVPSPSLQAGQLRFLFTP